MTEAVRYTHYAVLLFPGQFLRAKTSVHTSEAYALAALRTFVQRDFERRQKPCPPLEDLSLEALQELAALEGGEARIERALPYTISGRWAIPTFSQEEAHELFPHMFQE